jgi:hypothetical protein
MNGNELFTTISGDKRGATRCRYVVLRVRACTHALNVDGTHADIALARGLDFFLRPTGVMFGSA